MKRVLPLLLLLLATRTSPLIAQRAQPETADLSAFKTELESLRQALHIPGMSAAIVQDQQLMWAQGFGYADVERHVAATPDTPFHLASVTKPIAATLLMQLVEEGALDLDDPISQYGLHLQSPDVTVWHLLTHTSGGLPGTRHNYDGNRYALLEQVIASAAGRSFGRLLSERILLPLEMTRTAPNPSWQGEGWEGTLASLGLGAPYRHIPAVYHLLARPYQFDRNYDSVPGAYSLHFSPAAGLLSSVVDLARFDSALDQDRLLRPETREQMFAPAVSVARPELGYGLGWYSQRYKGTRLIWHSGGWPPSVSALLLKVPDENLTFIILANNHNLTAPYPLGDGDVLYSTLALAFYERFVFPRQFGETIPDVDWEAGTNELLQRLSQVTDPDARDVLERELWSYRKLYASVGRVELADRLLRVHRLAFPQISITPTAQAVYNVLPQPSPTALMPADTVFLGYLFFLWLLLTAIALSRLAWVLARDQTLPRPLKAAWLLSVLLFGPLALLANLLSDGRRGPGAQPMASWRRALGPALYGVTGNFLGLILALNIIYRFFPAEQGGALYALLGMLTVSWLFFWAPLAAWTSGNATWRVLPAALGLALLSTVMVAGGAGPTLFLLTERVFGGAAPNTLFFWTALVPAAVAGAVCFYPCMVWMVRRGMFPWPRQPVVVDSVPRDSTKNRRSPAI